nr:unnamed protein product [Digitaria exilis]
MGDSSGSASVSVDIERISFGGKTCPVSKDCSSAQKLRLCCSTISAYTTSILRVMRVLQLGAAPIPSDVPVPSVDDLADQVADVLDFFSLGSVMCLGVTAGAYVLTLFAILLNFLYYYGTRGLVKECLLQRYFSKVASDLTVQDCGSLVTEEQPYAMLMPMEYFLMGYGLYRAYQLSSSPRSPLSPCCISPELLSPESMGMKLKPIKTRVPINF